MSSVLDDLIDEYIYDNNELVVNDIKSILRTRGTKKGKDLQLLMTCLMHSSIELLDLFVDSGVDLYDEDPDGNSIIHFICNSGNIALLEHLIALGIAINIQNRLGQTPIMQAIKSSQWSCVGYLLDHCDLSITDKHTKSASDWMVMFCRDAVTLRKFISLYRATPNFDAIKFKSECNQFENNLALDIFKEE